MSKLEILYKYKYDTILYTVYKISNKIDGKFYVGTHKTKNLNDSYFGSGKYLTRAVKKYGIENFIKEILFVYDNPAEMYAKEAEIVNEDFLITENTYNLKIGGFGGWDYVNTVPGLNNRLINGYNASVSPFGKPGYEYIKELASNGIKLFVADPLKEQNRQKKIKESKEINGTQTTSNANLITASAIAKKKHTFKEIGHQQGSKNSQFGKRFKWINNKISNKKLDINEPLPNGWVYGKRKIK